MSERRPPQRFVDFVTRERLLGSCEPECTYTDAGEAWQWTTLAECWRASRAAALEGAAKVAEPHDTECAGSLTTGETCGDLIATAIRALKEEK